MSWIAEYDTQGREFPTCVHVTKATGTMMHGVTYVPIEDGKAVRTENAKLREMASELYSLVMHEDIYVRYPLSDEFDKIMNRIEASMQELGIGVNE